MSQIDQLDRDERERLDTELKRALDRLDLLVEATLDGIYDWDLPSGRLWHSPRLHRLLGYGEGEMGDAIERWEDLIHPDDRERTVDAVQAHFERNTPYAVDYRMRTKAGGYRWFFDQGRAIRDSEGRPVRMVGSMHDITDRVEAEATRTRLGRIVENSLNEIYVFDSETLHFIEVNSGAQANLGYSAAELEKLTPLDLKPEYTREKFAALIAPLYSGAQDQVGFETVHRRKDGSTYPVAVRLQLMAQETPPVFVAFIEDITERLEAEAERNRLGRIIENSLNEIYVVDAESLRFIEINAGALANLQYSADEMREMTPADIVPGYTPDDMRGLLTSLRDGEKRSVSLDSRHRRKDGSIYDVAVHLQYMGEEYPPVYVAFIEDISDRIKADEELREVHERLKAGESLFRSLAENQPGAVYRSRPDEPWTDIYFSDGIEELSGYPASDFINHAVRRFADIVHPDDMEIYYNTAIAREPNTGEYRIIHRDGSVRWVQDRNRGVYDDNKIRWIDGILVDVTAQKEAEAALAASEEQFRTMVDNMPGAIYRCLPDERWTDVFLSDAIEQLTGYPASEFLRAEGKRFEEIIHPDDLDGYMSAGIDPADDPYITEYRIIHADGSVRWLHDRSRVILDRSGNARWIDGVLLDVTARREAQDALVEAVRAREETEGQFRLMVENVPGAIYRCRPVDGWPMQYMSEGIEELTGYPASDFVENEVRSFNSLLVESDFDPFDNLLERIKAGNQLESEYRITRADGSERWVFERSKGVFDAQGRLQWLDGAIIDVTARKEAEAAARESETQFRLMVANVPGAIYRCRPVPGWPMQHMSDGIEMLSGYPASDFIDNRVRGLPSIIHPEDQDTLEALTEGLLRGEVLDKEYRIVHANGSIRWVHERAQSVRNAQGAVEWLDGAIVDITARKDAEAVARASQERFSGIVSNLPGAVYRTASDGWTMTFISEWIRDITGRAPAYFTDGGIEAFEGIVHPDDLESVEAGIARSIETGVPYENEYRIRHTDGSVIWVQETAHAVRGPDGQFECLDGVILDITARKLAEEAARKSEQRFASMVGNIAGTIYRTASDGWTLEYVSEQIRDLTGRGPDYFVDTGPEALASVVHPDDRPTANEKIAASMATGVPYENEYRVLHTDGSIRWAAEKGRVIRDSDGTFRWMDGVIFDVTDNKEAEEQLRRSEAGLANAQRIGGLGSWEWDLETETLWWAQGTYPMFGFKAEETTPNYELFLDHVHPDDRAAMEEAVQRSLATGKSYTLDFRFSRPDGEVRTFQDNAEPVLDSTGKAIALLGSVLDVTERKQAEERLRRSEASLANAQRIAHVGSWEWDVRNGKLYWSDEVFRIFGQDPETFELSLEDYYAAVHPGDRAWLRVAVEQGIAGGKPFSSDHRIVRPDGEVRVIHEESEVTLVENGTAARVGGTIQDVTEQRRAEEQLRASEARLANAQRIAHIGSWDWDLVRNESLWSEEVYRIAGLDPSGEPLTDEIVRSMVHPDDLARLEAQEARARERREPYSTDYRMIRPDGEARIVHETCEPGFDDSGEVVRLSGTVQDITEQRRAEEELRRSEASLANAQRIARIGNWDWDPATDDWYWSDEIFRMLGREQGDEEISLEGFYAAVHPDDVESLRAAVDDSVRQGAGYRLEFRVVRPDGEITEVSEQVEVVRDAAGRILRISGIDQDVTERRRAERELRETLERLDLVTNATVDCIYDWNPVADTLWHSPQMKDLLGYEVTEVRNHPDAWLARVHPDDIDLLSDALDRHFETRQPFELEYRVQAEDGHYVWLQDRGQAVWDETGTAVRMVGSLHDVTERKLAEERLRASEEQLRVITDNVPLFIAYIDRDERYRFVNRTEEEWFGRPAAELVGKSVRELLGEAAYRRIEAKIERVLVGDRVDTEDVYERSGGQRVLRTARVPHFAEDGSVLGYFLVAEDVTERKRVVEALRASEEQLRVITDNVPAVIVYVDKDERFRFANRAQSEWLGSPAAKTIGKTMREVVGEEHYARVKPEIDKVLAGQLSIQEITIDHPVKGRQVQHTTRIPHIGEDGSVLGYFAVAEDITERQKAEEALRDNEAQLRLVTDNVPAMIVYVDRDETIRFVNRAREEWSEQPASELIGRSVREVVSAETYEANRPLIDEVLSGTPNSGEHAVEHPRFGHRVLHTTRVPNFGERGDVVGYLAVIEDITERKTLEEELRHTQKMEAVGQLAGGISHEVNNMLTPIVGLTEMTLHSLPEDSKSRSNLEMVLTASHRVEELVKRILAFSRADTEEMVEFDLSEIVGETIPLLKATVPSTIYVDSEIEAGIGPVFGNPTAVQQVLMNLATNAAYAMEPEGGHLSVVLDRLSKREGKRVRHLLGAGERFARLTVKDSGCGMSEEVLDRVFEPFFTTREVGSGTGLGLSVVHGIVTKLGGKIDVESVKGEGTTFVIHIPLVGNSEDGGAPARR